MKGWVKGIIAGVVIAVIGVCVLLLGLYLNGWNFTLPVNGTHFEMRTFTAQNENTDLVLDIQAGTFSTEYTDGDRIIIEYPYADDYQTYITENNGKLTVSHPEGYFKITFTNCNVSIPHTTIKLPKGKTYNLDVDMAAGTFKLAEGNFGNIKIKINAGTIKGDGITCKMFNCEMDAGTLSFDKIVCEEFTYSIDAGTLKVSSLTADRTKITMDAGSVHLGFTGALEEYGVRAAVNAGSCKIGGRKAQNQIGTTDKTIDVEVDAGSVKLTFSNAD